MRKRMSKLTKYGISEQEYLDLIKQKGNFCWICGRPPKNRALSIDHNHVWYNKLKKGNKPIKHSIRGLLCYQCNNKLIGNKGDRQNAIQLFKAAVRYLEDAEKEYQRRTNGNSTNNS